MSTFLPFTDEHRALRDTARRFVDNEIRPYYAQWENDGMVPKALYRKAGALGLLLTGIPEEYGGAGGDFLFAHIINEELGFAGATGPQFGLHSDIVAPYILHNGTEAQLDLREDDPAARAPFPRWNGGVSSVQISRPAL